MSVAIVVIAVVYLWQSNLVQLPEGVDISGLLVSPVQAQTSCSAVDPAPPASGQGAIYYNSCSKNFRAYTDNSWKDLGSQWRQYADFDGATTSDGKIKEHITNTNTGNVYISTALGVGVNGIGEKVSDNWSAINLLNNTDNLIYGAIDSTSNATASLLKLELFSTTPKNILKVNASGVVTIGSTGFGKLITPEICIGDETNCDISGSDGASKPQEDAYWSAPDRNNFKIAESKRQDYIINSNHIDGIDENGGDVHITHNLQVNGDILLEPYNKSEIKGWQSLDVLPRAIGGNIDYIWTDVYNSRGGLALTQFVDSGDQITYTDNGTSTEMTYLVVTADEGKIVVVRDNTQNTSSIPILDKTTTGAGQDHWQISGYESTRHFNAVCSIGSEQSTSNAKSYRLIAVGNDGVLSEYYMNNSGVWTWDNKAYSFQGEGGVTKTVNFNAIFCKTYQQKGGIIEQYSTFEAYIVGDKGAIVRYSGSVGVAGSFYPVQNPCNLSPVKCDTQINHGGDLKAIWATKYLESSQTRYYAVGTSNGGKNRVYYWNQNTTTQAGVKFLTDSSINSINLNTVRGTDGLCDGCSSKEVWAAGNNGLLIQIIDQQSDAFGNLVNLEPPKINLIKNAGAPTYFYNITGILPSKEIVLVSLETADGAQPITMMAKYFQVSKLAEQYNPYDWPIIGFSNKVLSNLKTISGVAKSKANGNTNQFRVLGVGGKDSALFDANVIRYSKNSDGDFVMLTAVQKTSSNWTSRSVSAAVQLYSAWQPTDQKELMGSYSFVGGGAGYIKNGEGSSSPINVRLIQDEKLKTDVVGIWGYRKDGLAIPYDVYAVTKNIPTASSAGHILHYDSSAIDFSSVKDVGYGFNSIAGSTNGSIIVAVGNSGKLYYCSGTNDCSDGLFWTEPTLAPGSATLSGDLTNVWVGESGGVPVAYITSSNKTIYRCTFSGSISCATSSFSPAPDRAMYAVWGSGSNVWAAGGDQIYKTTTDSNVWGKVSLSIPNNINLNSISGTSDLVFFGGDKGRIIYTENANGTLSNLKTDTLIASSDKNAQATFKSMSGYGWVDDTGVAHGSVWAVSDGSLAVKYEEGSQSISGDLKVARNRWGGIPIDKLKNVFSPAKPVECDDGEFVTGVEFYEVSIAGTPYKLVNKFRCRKL